VELEHRFEVPVGIESAWPSLLDMSQVADCFPGATLTSADGDEYTGSVKIKLGPIQLTYQGKARIVEADESAHRAVIEASGAASRSASTASMTVTATATAVAEDRTAVDMVTNLTITGRPAQFGRGVMVEVGNKILGQFADCLSGKLAQSAAPAAAGGSDASGSAEDGSGDTGSDATGSADADAAGSGEADAGAAGSGEAGADAASTAAGVAGDRADGDAAARGSATNGAAGGAAGAAAVGATTSGAGAGAGPRHAAPYTRSPEPIDLLESAGPSIVKRVVPLIAGLILLLVLRSIVKRRHHHED
jgi:carbon monoxide dehydrogenase subunit G